jgi:hypothetical protein
MVDAARPSGERKDTMYYEAVSQCTRMLKNIGTWLDKAEKHAAAKKFDVNILITERLAPDMKPFIYQVQSACDYVKAAAAWLSGQVPPKREDNEQTIDDARARIQKTIAFAESVREVQYAAASDRKSQPFLGAGQAPLWKELPLADDNPERLLPRGDCVRHPPPQWDRHRQDGFSRSC